MKRVIPDLRAHHNEFTIEHCTFLQTRLGMLLEEIHGPGIGEIAEQTNPQAMHSDLLTVFTEKQLGVLFGSEIGKGLIIGMFYAVFVQSESIDDEGE